MKIDISLGKDRFCLSARASWPDTGMTVIAGPSGAGKTSLLRSILGLERAQGHVALGDDVLLDDGVFVPVHKRHIAWVGQHDDVFAHQSVRQNLEFAARFAPAQTPDVDDLARLFLLDGVLAQNAGSLSGGQKQRLVLARALCANPRLLALDEPFGALDAETRHELLALLARYCAGRGLPVLFISHDFDTLTRLADFMLYMEAGRITAQAPLNTCLMNKALPFRYREDACTIVQARAKDYRAADSLNVLDVSGIELLVPGAALPKGQGVRLRLRAGDISLGRTRHDDSSVLNVLPARIEGVEAARGPLAQGLVNVTLALMGTHVLVRITEKSAGLLALQEGDSIFAHIKASALVGG